MDEDLFKRLRELIGGGAEDANGHRKRAIELVEADPEGAMVHVLLALDTRLAVFTALIGEIADEETT